MGNSNVTISNVSGGSIHVGKAAAISASLYAATGKLHTGHTIRKVVEIPVECSTDAFFKFFKEEASKLHRITSNKTWVDSVDSNKWLFFHPTETSVDLKYEVGGVDTDSKKITYKVVEGEVLQFYNTFTVTLEVTVSSTAKWTIECEKKSASNPDPDVSLEFLRELTIAANAYIATAGEA